MSVIICQIIRFNIPENLDLHSRRQDFPKWITFVNTELRWKQKQAAVSCCEFVLTILFQYLSPKSCMLEICLLRLYLHKVLTFHLILLFLLSLLLFLFFFFLSFFLALYSYFLSWSSKNKIFFIFFPNIRSANPIVHQLLQYKPLYRRNQLFKHYIS
jgi:hypothetical protein